MRTIEKDLVYSLLKREETWQSLYYKKHEALCQTFKCFRRNPSATYCSKRIGCLTLLFCNIHQHLEFGLIFVFNFHSALALIVFLA